MINNVTIIIIMMIIAPKIIITMTTKTIKIIKLPWEKIKNINKRVRKKKTKTIIIVALIMRKKIN